MELLDKRVVTLLTGVTDAQAQEIAEAIADLLVERGFNSEDEGCGALISIEDWPWPLGGDDRAESFVQEMMMAGANVVIPQPAEDH